MSAESPLIDTDYPPSTASQRNADDLTARGAIDWMAVLKRRAKPRTIAKVREAFEAVLATGDALDAAHRLCLAHVAVHDRAVEAAGDKLELLEAALKILVDLLVAEEGVGAVAPFAGMEGLPFRDLDGVLKAPDLELLFRGRQLVAAISAGKHGPKVLGACGYVSAALEGYRVPCMEEVVSRDLAAKVLEGRKVAARAFNTATKKLEAEATEAKVWDEMSPRVSPFRGVVLWFGVRWKKVVNFGAFRRRVRSAAARHAILAVFLLALPFVTVVVIRVVVSGGTHGKPATVAAGSGPAAVATQPTGRIDMIMGNVYNRDSRDWTVTWHCEGITAHGSFTLAALSGNPQDADKSEHNPRLGYGHNGQFNCPATLEGGSGTCVMHGGDACLIQAGVLAPAPP